MQVRIRDIPAIQASMPVSQLIQLNFFSGIAAGMLASAVTHPVDVVYVKTVTSARRRAPTEVAAGLSGYPHPNSNPDSNPDSNPNPNSNPEPNRNPIRNPKFPDPNPDWRSQGTSGAVRVSGASSGG